MEKLKQRRKSQFKKSFREKNRFKTPGAVQLFWFPGEFENFPRTEIFSLFSE